MPPDDAERDRRIASPVQDPRSREDRHDDGSAARERPRFCWHGCVAPAVEQVVDDGLPRVVPSADVVVVPRELADESGLTESGYPVVAADGERAAWVVSGEGEASCLD